MSHFRHANRTGVRYARAGWFFAFCVGIIFFTPIRSYVEGAVLRVMQPIFKIAQTVDLGVARTWGLFRAKQSLINENATLKTTLAEAEAELLDRRVLVQENDQLRRLMGRETSPQGILAEVLASAGYAPYDTLILDVGEHNHIRVGDRVVADDASIVGTITNVYATTAKATLFSSSGMQVDGVLAGSDIFVTVVGQGGGMFAILLPRDTPLSIGDVVLAPGTSRVLGVVGSISMGTTDPFKKVLVRSPINPSTLRFVRVLPGAS